MKKNSMQLRVFVLIFIVGSFPNIQQLHGQCRYSIYQELEDDDDLWDFYELPSVQPMPDFSAKTLDQSLIYAACSPTDTELVPTLIAQGANPNYQWYPSTQTPIYLASFFGNFENVVYLLKMGANPNLGEGALLGVLRGIFEEQFKGSIQRAHNILIFLINNGADYGANQVQELIRASPELKEHLISAIQQSKIA